MLELAMAVASVVVMARIADLENRSAVLWGGIMVAACAASFYVMWWPLVRVFLAFVAVIVVYMATKFVPR